MGDQVAELERRLGLRLRDRALLAQALVHRSYLNEALEPGTLSNERMEFLGDAVLGLVAAQWLYHRYPDLPEGRLTELRAHLVKGDSLAVVGQRLELGSYLRLGRGEDASGGRRRGLNLARAFEAVIGAVFLDRGFIKTARWLEQLLEPELTALGGGELAEDPKSRLQHTAQLTFGATPRYHTVGIEGPEHARTFTVNVLIDGRALGSGSGLSKRVAERIAAEAALQTIESELAGAVQLTAAVIRPDDAPSPSSTNAGGPHVPQTPGAAGL